MLDARCSFSYKLSARYHIIALLDKDNMDKAPSTSQNSVRIVKATLIMILLQVLLLWCSTQCALDIGLEKEVTRVGQNDLPVGSLHNSTAFTLRTNSRVLMGIMAAVSPDLRDYMRVHREVFALHPNVCSLKQLQTTLSPSCRLVYTFVIGANEKGPTEIVNDALPILASNASHTLAGDDVTLLNIRENMNEGKSQTWFYYASTLAEDLEIDYVGKMDLDTMLYLDKFFDFQATHLPISPHDNHILVGQLVDKDTWYIDKYGKRFPGKFWNKEKLVLPKLSPGYHLYVQGGCYIMSNDLVNGVVRIANTVPKEDYAEQHEDHDISTMAFISTVSEQDPNYAATISMKQMTIINLFWKHPLKRNHRKWGAVWNAEKERLGKVLLSLTATES